MCGFSLLSFSFYFQADILYGIAYKYSDTPFRINFELNVTVFATSYFDQGHMNMYLTTP